MIGRPVCADHNLRNSFLSSSFLTIPYTYLSLSYSIMTLSQDHAHTTSEQVSLSLKTISSLGFRPSSCTYLSSRPLLVGSLLTFSVRVRPSKIVKGVYMRRIKHFYTMFYPCRHNVDFHQQQQLYMYICVALFGSKRAKEKAKYKIKSIASEAGGKSKGGFLTDPERSLRISFPLDNVNMFSTFTAPFVKLSRAIAERGIKGTVIQLYTVRSAHRLDNMYRMNLNCKSSSTMSRLVT